MRRRRRPRRRRRAAALRLCPSAPMLHTCSRSSFTPARPSLPTYHRFRGLLDEGSSPKIPLIAFVYALHVRSGRSGARPVEPFPDNPNLLREIPPSDAAPPRCSAGGVLPRSSEPDTKRSGDLRSSERDRRENLACTYRPPAPSPAPPHCVRPMDSTRGSVLADVVPASLVPRVP